ncbi:MAG TPA: hypothetical protein VFO62_08305 [Candidatus Binatia bacterium]|nr:hypothetical protein [Candidatus Binatia bacterium]
MKKLMIAMVFLSVAIGAPGCERDKGAMEKAGEKIDETVDKLTHPNEGPVEKAGRKVDEAVDDVTE